MIMRSIGVILLTLFLLIGISEGGEEDIYKIIILGNVKVEEAVIRGAIKSQEGRAFSLEKVREDLRSIFNLGLFTDAQVDIKSTPQGKEVIFVVVEKPSLKEILITGNEKVKLDDIKEKITLTTRSILNLEKVKESSEQIRRLYFSKGYYGVKVEHKVNYLETNEAVVTFAISEGPKGHIQKIIFKGNRHIKSSDLKKVMMTKQRNIFSIITKTGTLDEDILKNDLQLLNAYYMDHGFIEAKISEPKLDLSNPKKIRIEIEILEGPLYHVGTIDFKGDLLTTKEDLFRTLKMKRNDVYSNTAIRKDVNALTEKFANQGYAYVEINPETTVDNKELFVHITYDIEKKKQVSFEKIQIVGNSKTRDKVIRRELRVAEGELYSASGMNKSRDRLKRTGYFKEVELTTSRGSTEDKMNLDVKVEEAPTGAISFGIGYSTLESVVGSASISDRNLFGYGYHGVLKFSLGAETQNFKMSFTDPYFLGYPVSAGIDLYHERVELFDTYSYKITGGTLHFGKELAEKIRLDLTYKLENINVYDVKDTASTYIKEQEGRKTTSAIALSPSIDTRDDYFSPKKGGRHSLFIQNAGGILGGDNYFVKATGETSWFFPLPLNTTLNLRAKAGMITPYGGKTLPIYEKFFVGGIQTVRGFEYGKAGPIDENKEPVGSKYMTAFNAEWIFPLAREIGLRGALFFDVGKGFDKLSDKDHLILDYDTKKKLFRIRSEPGKGLWPLKFGAGPGIRWFSPFGPIHIDIGFNLSPKKGEKRNVIEFTAGTIY
ncbi:MAG: outer membrane protein assembly factor BamA [Syntrophaceae bacterium]|nr:outer membrane protein assembly factor BamA [Syntrophaceae bacterium]